MVLLFVFFPRCVNFGVAGLEEAENLAGENVLRLIQVRLEMQLLYESSARLVKSGAA